MRAALAAALLWLAAAAAGAQPAPAPTPRPAAAAPAAPIPRPTPETPADALAPIRAENPSASPAGEASPAAPGGAPVGGAPVPPAAAGPAAAGEAPPAAAEPLAPPSAASPTAATPAGAAPAARPDALSETVSATAPRRAPRPVARSPIRGGAARRSGGVAASVAPGAGAPSAAPSPETRPRGLAARGRPAPEVPAPPPEAAPESEVDVGAGGLCGDRRLSGSRVPRIGVESGGCGVPRPIRLAAVSGVRLDPPVTVGCEVAVALADWTDAVAKPAAVTEIGSRLRVLKTAAGYACRPRNGQAGARLSEHARGRAIDISGFRFDDGRGVTVEDGWRGEGSAFLRRAWRGACGHFGTVLGPEADRFHRNHFHFDVAANRNPYCR